MVRSHLSFVRKEADSASKWEGSTRCLICFETSSIPNVNFEIATDISSFAIESWAVAFAKLNADFGAAFAPGCKGYGSPARIALA